MYFILLVLVLVALYYIPKGEKDPLANYKSRAHVFSGINPDLYYLFLNELEAYKNSATIDSAKDHLYAALEALEELALYTKSSSSTVYDSIKDIVNDLGDAAETVLMKKALSSGVRFTPKYLKESQFVQ